MSAPAEQVADRERISVEEWEALFPLDLIENNMSSAKFIKQLTLAAVSMIAYFRDAFPKNSYSNKTLDGMYIKLLKDRCEDELARFVHTSLKQAFDAFDKKLVHKLVLCFYNGECVAENLIEYYSFDYSYNYDGVASSTNSGCSLQSVVSRTLMLIRSIVVFTYQCCQNQLPINYDISWRLYYNEDCPKDYQVPGFRHAVGPDHLAPTRSEAVRHVRVETPYHKLIFRSFVRGRQGVSDAAAASASTGQSEMTQTEHEDIQDELPSKPYSDTSMEVDVSCPCGKQDTQGQMLLICQYCHTIQHGACFGLLAPPPDMAHCCEACIAREPDRTPTCSLLVGLPARKQQCVSVFRRTLVLCSETAAVSGAQLQAEFRLSPTSTAKLLKLLVAHYIIIMPDSDYDDLETPREINHLRLKLTMKTFFKMDDEEHDTADRLMMEEGQ